MSNPLEEAPTHVKLAVDLIMILEQHDVEPEEVLKALDIVKSDWNMRLDDDIHNFYEKLVLEEIEKRKLNERYNDDVMADFCCTVLNQLPPRYIRYDVDMAFYLTQTDRLDMQQRVELAINFAIDQIAKKKDINE